MNSGRINLVRILSTGQVGADNECILFESTFRHVRVVVLFSKTDAGN